MRIPRFIELRLVCLGLLLAVTLLGWGCATTEFENTSARPWNAPKAWEHGLPTGFYEGR